MNNTAVAVVALTLLFQVAMVLVTFYVGLFVMDAKTFLVTIALNFVTAIFGSIRKLVD